MTGQEILNLARKRLQDDAKVTYPDPELLAWLAPAVAQIRADRPDLFIGSGKLYQGFAPAFTTSSNFTDGSAGGVALPLREQEKMANWIAANVLLRPADVEGEEAAVASLLALGSRP